MIEFLIDEKTNISIAEDNLLRAMEKLELGEIIQVEIPEEPKTVKVSTMTQNQLLLIEIIRQGCQHFDKIEVADGDPVSIVVSYTDGEFRCRKTIVF